MSPDVAKEGDENDASRMLIDAALRGDELLVDEILQNEAVDVNYMGIVNLKVKHTDCIQHEEAPDELKTEYIEFKTDVTPLFSAAHSGHVEIVKKLLVSYMLSYEMILCNESIFIDLRCCDALCHPQLLLIVCNVWVGCRIRC